MRLASLLLALALLQAGRTDTLAARLDGVLAAPRLREARIGVAVYSTASGRAVYERNADRPLLLASNAKLLTTACALALLGSEYRYRTTVAWKEGSGDLHVFGAGDPLIGGRLYRGPDGEEDPTRLFREAAAKLRVLGRTRFSGNLVLHAGIFDGALRPEGWTREDPLRWYCAPVGGLSFNDNCVQIRIRPGPPGEPAVLHLVPETRAVTLVNRIKTVRADPEPYGFRRGNAPDVVVAWGEVKADAGETRHDVAVADPARYFGTVFRETLERDGVRIEGEIVTSDALTLEGRVMEFVLAEHTLGDVVRACNTVSQNLYAELILKLLGFRFRGEGSTRAGLEVVREFLATEIGVSDAELQDGSGLSRGNRASASSIAKLLRFMQAHRHGRTLFDSLAPAGAEEGTLRKRLKSIAGRVRAKSGHLWGVSTLSGYAQTAGGDTLVFSILMNGVPGADAVQDQLCELMVASTGE